MSAAPQSAVAAMELGDVLELAELWAGRGVPVFPIEVWWDDKKGKTNKAPLTDHGFLDASTDLRRVRLMFNTAHPWRSGVLAVGLHPGPAGIVVIDVDGARDVAAFDARDLPATYAPTTASGSRHYWYNKREPVRIGTSCEWSEVDVVRSDEGFVVAPDVATPWGSWECFDDYPGDVARCPAELWEVLDAGNGAPGSGSTAVSARGLDAIVARLRAVERHQDAEALELLCGFHGGHHPYMKGRRDDDAELFVTRPGKAAGTSASIGYTAPGVVKVFSSSWPGFVEGHRYVVDGARLVDADDLELVGKPVGPDDVSGARNRAPADGHGVRRLVFTPASAIPVKRVRWVWENRLAIGTLGLLAGPEGLGKSLLAYWVAARITHGELPGELHGTPKSVLVCAAEDDWEHTIGPRLMAHGADRDRVYRIDVLNDAGLHTPLSLPADILDVGRGGRELDAALLILDPLMSRLHASLDSHRDGEVRQALEPLVAELAAARMAAFGIIHHNKSGTTNPLDAVMASKAFTAVARSVHTVIKDPDDNDGARRLFGTPKNNLGLSDLPVKSFTVNGWYFEAEDGPGNTGQLQWGDDVTGSIEDALRRSANDTPEKHTALTEAVGWLTDYMKLNGGRVLAQQVKDAAADADHSVSTLRRARIKLKIATETEKEFQGKTWWVSLDAARLPVQIPLGDTLLNCLESVGEEDAGSSQRIQEIQPGVLGDDLDSVDCPACTMFGPFDVCPHVDDLDRPF